MLLRLSYRGKQPAGFGERDGGAQQGQAFPLSECRVLLLYEDFHGAGAREQGEGIIFS